MIRDQEIERLELYAKGLGLEVVYSKPDPARMHVGAEVILFNGVSTLLVVYKTKHTSKTTIVLNLLHELGHHLSWIYKNRKDDPKLLEALEAEDKQDPQNGPISKEKRKLIYLMEKEDADYRIFAAKEADVRLNEHILLRDKELDIWIYRHYYLTGYYPEGYQVMAMKKKLRKKYAKKEGKKRRRVLQRKIKRS